MLRRFEESNGVKVSIKRKEEVMCKLRKLAEKLHYEYGHCFGLSFKSDPTADL